MERANIHKEDKMRRKDREVLDRAQIKAIIEDCYCCRLGFYDEGEVYILPLNFGYVEEGEARIFYFHGAKVGRKANLVAKAPMVGFKLDTGYQLQTDEEACECSARFQSVIGTGQVMAVEDPEEKITALQAIMKQNTQRADWEFSDKMVQGTLVFKLLVKDLACKFHE